MNTGKIRHTYRGEGFALTGYVVPWCVVDGAWMLWENSSAAVAVVVIALAEGLRPSTNLVPN